MKPSMKNQSKAKFHEVKGKVKETIGKLVNDRDLESRGKSENLAGKIEKKVGQINKVFGK